MKQEILLSTSAGENTLIVREGKAMELKEPLVINIAGDIDTVKSFVAKRYLKEDPLTADQRAAVVTDNYNLQQFYKETAVVTFDKKNLSISLDVNPQDFYGPKVSGKLEVSDELAPFKINEPSGIFSREQLVKLLRFNKRFFSDAAVHDNVLKAFQSLSLTGNTSLDASNDNRGNAAAKFEKKIDSSKIPTTFYMNIPVFKGQEPKKFLVEICLDSSESSVIFWFESVELAELKDAIVDGIFDEQKKLFADFVIVNK